MVLACTLNIESSFPIKPVTFHESLQSLDPSYSPLKSVLYPAIDPVLVDFGWFKVHWYGITYLLAFGTFWLLGYYRIKKSQAQWTVAQLNDACFYMVLGVIVGGRIGYALFYALDQLLADPIWLFRLWEGGMSFHGGLLGVITALLIWCRVNQLSFWQSTDTVAPFVAPGLGFGRLGNFINAELPGRVTESAFGVHFQCQTVADINFLCTTMYEAQTRHVSSLYQAFAEGIVLFVVIWLYSRKTRQLGRVSALFLITYGVLRFITEFFRHPDPEIGFILFDWMTIGQVLSSCMIIAGVVLILPVTSNKFSNRSLS